MKCITMQLIAMLFFALINRAMMKKIYSRNYFQLINDVRKYYWSPCVTFVQSENYHDLNITTLIHTWSREFSRRNIMTATITFSNLQLVNEYKNDQKQFLRPLFVVLLDTDKTMNAFIKTTKDVQSISFPVWFVMFLPRSGNPLEKYCMHPTGNVFNVNFSTLMLVLCYDHPILVEWYAIRDNRTRTFELATWNDDKGLILKTRKSLYDRRNDMFGEALRVASVKESAFFLLENNKIDGFLGLLLIELSQAMNFTIEILDPVNEYGSWNLNDMTWTGVIGQLVTGEADIGVSEFTITSSRLHAVDFTMPLIRLRNRLYLKQPNGFNIQWSGYFKAFTSRIWIMLSTIIIISSILLTVMKTKGRFSINLIFENYIRVWGIYCQQSLSEFPKESSTRLAFFSIYVSSIIILSAYSASVISSLTLTTAVLPFSTIEGYVKDSSYKLIVMKNSAEHDMSEHVTDPVFLKMYKLLTDRNLPSTMLDGFKQVCEQKKLAFYTTEIFKNAMDIHLQCKIVYIDSGKMDNIAMPLTKANPYIGFINYHLQRFRNNGVMNKLKNRYLLTNNQSKTTYEAVSLKDVALILTIITFGTLLALFILIIEKAYYIFRTRYKSNKLRIIKQSNNLGLNLQNNHVKNFQRNQNFQRNYMRSVEYWP